jgi:hypothetical protein
MPQTWAADWIAKSILLPANYRPSRPELPQLQGSANWYSRPMVADQALLPFHTRDGTVYYLGQALHHRLPYTGGLAVNGDNAYAAIHFEGTTGKLRWEFKLRSPWTACCRRRQSVFRAEEGNFFARRRNRKAALGYAASAVGPPIRCRSE